MKDLGFLTPPLPFELFAQLWPFVLTEHGRPPSPSRGRIGSHLTMALERLFHGTPEFESNFPSERRASGFGAIQMALMWPVRRRDQRETGGLSHTIRW